MRYARIGAATLVALALAVLALPNPSGPHASYLCDAGVWSGTTYTNDFTGNPSSPANCRVPGWEMSTHSRNSWTTPTAWDPVHGPDCSGHPGTHHITTWDEMIYACRDHLMTASNEGGFGSVTFAPGALARWDTAPAIFEWWADTAMFSQRAWWRVTVSHPDHYLQIPAGASDVDLNGEPRHALIIKQQWNSGCSGGVAQFSPTVMRDWVPTSITQFPCRNHPASVPESDTTRILYRLELTDTVVNGEPMTHVRFYLPVQEYVTAEHIWLDRDIPRLPFSEGVIQLSDNSYTPTKDCTPTPNAPPCWASTTHWDGVKITNATPLGIVYLGRRLFRSVEPSITLPDTLGGTLRITCKSPNLGAWPGTPNPLRASFDGGPPVELTFVQGSKSSVPWGADGRSYRVPVPSGAATMTIIPVTATTQWACENGHIWR